MERMRCPPNKAVARWARSEAVGSISSSEWFGPLSGVPSDSEPLQKLLFQIGDRCKMNDRKWFLVGNMTGHYFPSLRFVSNGPVIFLLPLIYLPGLGPGRSER